MVEQLCKNGNEVHILQKNSGGPLPHIPERLKNYKVTTDVVPFEETSKTNFIGRYKSAIKYINNCKKYITGDYDAAFIQSNTVAGFAVRAVRKKLPNAIVTFNVQDIFPYNASFSGMVKKNSIKFKLLAAEQRYGYKRSNHIITISEDMKDTLVSDGVDADKIDVIYNWSYQDELFEISDLTPVEHIIKKDYFNVVYAGNIGIMQNVDIIIETAKLMKDNKNIWFNIIGNGVYKEKLKAKAEKYGISNISFHPMQPPELAPLIYSAADVNVIPLVKDVYRTALPSKTATCLACQKPIIFAIGKESKFGRKVTEEANCPVVDADNPQELAEAIRNVMNERKTNRAGDFFLQYCGITKNSKKYAEIITSK